MPGKSFAKTDPGLVRDRNEDLIWADDDYGLYAVADGVGGEAAGDLASRIAIDALRLAGSELASLVTAADRSGKDADRRAVFDRLTAAVEAANDEVFRRAREDESLRGMMSTLTGVVLGQHAAYVVHIGDSRLYLLRDGHMDQVTVDHTLAEELIRAGRVRREELASFRFRNVLSRAIGERSQPQVDLLYVDLRDGDELLLCSDGLTDMVAELDIGRAWSAAADEPAQSLVELANDHGGGDNVSAVIVRFMLGNDPTTQVAAVPGIEHTAKLDLLDGMPFCEHLSADERMKVLRYVHEVVCEPGREVFAQGDEGQDFYLVVEGSLDVLVGGARVNVMQAGSHFGEIALVSGAARSATVVAREPSRLFRVSRDGFYDLGQKDQAIAVKMLWSFSQSLARRVTTLSEELVQARRS